MERRIYEIGRKRCGKQRNWNGLSLENLQKLCGSRATLREFRRMVTDIVRRHEAEDGFPDYTLTLDGDVLRMAPKTRFLRRTLPANARDLELDLFVYDDARRILGGWCVQEIETQWRNWVAAEDITVRHPEKHFLAFCKQYIENHGVP